MTIKTYQIQIELKGVKPKVWRRVLLPSNLYLTDLHEIIQATMGWTDTHLHQFTRNGIYYVPSIQKDEIWGDDDGVAYEEIKISDLLKNEKDKIVYEYDFGDGWEHNIILEKKLPYDKNAQDVICIKGKNNCPPEDCGGVWGYANMLEILKQPEHEEHENYIEWLGEEFDPTYFDKDEINEMFN